MAFTFGNFFGLVYSLSGGILSCVLMILMKKIDKFSPIGISVIGGISHNIGQIIMAIIIVENTKIVFYLPILLISGIITGILIGILASIIIKNLKKFDLF